MHSPMDYFIAWLIGLPFVAAFMLGTTYIMHRLGVFERHKERVLERSREKEEKR